MRIRLLTASACAVKLCVAEACAGISAAHMSVGCHASSGTALQDSPVCTCITFAPIGWTADTSTSCIVHEHPSSRRIHEDILARRALAPGAHACICLQRCCRAASPGSPGCQTYPLPTAQLVLWACTVIAILGTCMPSCHLVSARCGRSGRHMKQLEVVDLSTLRRASGAQRDCETRRLRLHAHQVPIPGNALCITRRAKWHEVRGHVLCAANIWNRDLRSPHPCGYSSTASALAPSLCAKVDHGRRWPCARTSGVACNLLLRRLQLQDALAWHGCVHSRSFFVLRPYKSRSLHTARYSCV